MSEPVRNQTAAITPMKGLLMLAVVAALIVAFIMLCRLFDVKNFWVGILFLFYWAGIEQSRLGKLLPVSLGAFTGLALCLAVLSLPQLLGPETGGWVLLGILSLVVYLLILGKLTFAINQTTMLFLTVGSIPVVQAGVAISELFMSLALGILFFGFLGGLGALLARRKTAQEA